MVEGQGRGGFRPIFAGMNSVGRDASQRISLSFGDESISREEHAFITYDEEARCFYLQHGGKPNIIRLGGKPVLTPMELKANDLIRIGRTTLRFVPCCGPNFLLGRRAPGGMRPAGRTSRVRPRPRRAPLAVRPAPAPGSWRRSTAG